MQFSWVNLQKWSTHRRLRRVLLLIFRGVCHLFQLRRTISPAVRRPPQNDTSIFGEFSNFSKWILSMGFGKCCTSLLHHKKCIETFNIGNVSDFVTFWIIVFFLTYFYQLLSITLRTLIIFFKLFLFTLLTLFFWHSSPN